MHAHAHTHAHTHTHTHNQRPWVVLPVSVSFNSQSPLVLTT